MPLNLLRRLVDQMGRRRSASHPAAVTPSTGPVQSHAQAPAAAPTGKRRRRGGRRRKKSGQPAAAATPADLTPAADEPVGEDVESPDVPQPSGESWSPSDFPVAQAEGETRFHDLDLPLEIMHAVADLGFRYCTPIQASVLPLTRDGRNVAGRAQTGTGKTAAFLNSIFRRFLLEPRTGQHTKGTPRALILAPTRELVIQIVRDARALGHYCSIRVAGVYGGMDYAKQQAELTRGHVDVIVATPGRLLDFCGKGIIRLNRVEILVIDEADRMLDMGFIPDVRRIVRQTPPRERRQTLLFSATLTEDVTRLMQQWMPEPEIVEVAPDHVAADTIQQVVYAVTSREKMTVLYNVIQRHGAHRVLVFVNRRTEAQRVTDMLHRLKVKADLLSGAVTQTKRLSVLEGFRDGSLGVVVATDVAGRGLHIDDVTHVINYDLPYESEDYVHRIGRTGRVGAEGTAISFACEDESFIIPEIEKYLGASLTCELPPEELLAPLPELLPAKARPPREGQDGRGRGRGPERRTGRSRPGSGGRSGRSPRR